VRHTLTPAPADVTVPAADLIAVAFGVSPTLCDITPADGHLVPCADRSGGSPPREPLVGTVVLLI
jgi:hypothetical protein